MTRLPGYRGNLTAEQEAKLRQLWLITLTHFGLKNPDPTVTVASLAPATSETSSQHQTEKPAARRGFWGRKKEEPAAPAAGVIDASDDKYGQVKEFYQTLEKYPADEIREAFWAMLKADHPDVLFLRFLRARKWDVNKALVMLFSTLQWRKFQMKVDDDILFRGEGGALADSQSSDPTVKKNGADFLTQLREGKSFMHGADKEGRPIFYIRVRLHHGHEQDASVIERFTVLLIESSRLCLQDPVETGMIVFDMTGFTLANMDYAPVKFIIKAFEANYPESLGAILIHKAPWIFQGIWKIIKGWLDPVVAAKVHFTNDVKALEAFIDRKHIITELDGDEQWTYKYIEPVPGEDDLLKDKEGLAKLRSAREALAKQYEELTFQWINANGGSGSPELVEKRDELAQALSKNYWDIDPYIRARTVYDRAGVIGRGGVINLYPAERPTTAAATTNGHTDDAAVASATAALASHSISEKSAEAKADAPVTTTTTTVDQVQ